MINNKTFTEYVDIDYISKKLNKQVHREYLEKKGLTPIGKFIKSRGGVIFIYSKKKVDKLIKELSTKPTKLLTDMLNKLSTDQLNDITKYVKNTYKNDNMLSS